MWQSSPHGRRMQDVEGEREVTALRMAIWFPKKLTKNFINSLITGSDTVEIHKVTKNVLLLNV